MGRILRKKSASKPKAKSEDSRMVSESRNGNSTPAKTVSMTAISRQATKAPVNYPGKQYVDASIQFLREVRVELRKVTWPSRKQTIGSTVVVTIMVLLISIFLGVVDMGLQSLLNVVIR